MDSNAEIAFHRPKLSLHAKDDFGGANSLPELIDFNAEFNPNHIFCKQAEVVGRKDEEDVYHIRNITMKETKLAIDGCVSWISSALADSVPKKTGPVALYLESDVGLFMHLAALLKMKIPVLLLSARLSPTTVKHLLLTTKARGMLVSPRTKRSLRQEFDAVVTLDVVNYTCFLDHVPTTKNSKTAQHDEEKGLPEDTKQYPLILHSSGTTGMPKPIPVSGRYIIVYAACHEFPEYMTIDWANMSTLPLYHGFGLLAPCLSLSVGMTCCFPPSSLIPGAYSTIKLIQAFPASSLMTVPSIMDDMLGREEDLASLKFVAIGGGQLNPDTGIAMAEKSVPLLNHYGVTEIGALAPIFCPGMDYDWHYLRIRIDLGLRLEAIDKEEAVNDVPQDPSRFKLVGLPVDSSERFEIQDEMETRPNVNRIEIKLLGRRDDMIVLKTGEKVLARRLEDLLNSDPHIKISVCLGQGYMEVVVLIEPSSSMPPDHDKAVEHVWGLIEAVNPQLDQHARVSSKAAIILKPKDKVIPRSDKGSIMRREIHNAFEGEIQAAYASLGFDSLDLVEFSLDAGNVERSIQEMTQAVLGTKKQPGDSSHINGYMTNDDDFFEGGMDSLQAVRLARYLDAAVQRVVSSKPEPEREKMKSISAEFIYRYPSVRFLTSVLSSQLWGSEAEKEAKRDQQNRQAEVSKLLTEATEAMAVDSPGDESAQFPDESQVILLTGATGSLGAHVLGFLARDKRVGRIICVNRSKPAESGQQEYEKEAEARQRRIMTDAGIDLTASGWSKIHLLHGPLLNQFDQLAHSITHIIHLAWPMDFQRRVASFKPHIDALRELIKLARAASRSRSARGKVRLIFSSSIAVIRNYGTNTGKARQVMVPEKILPDPKLMVAMGYAEAKWICEQMLNLATERYGVEIEAITVRVGQLSGGAGRAAHVTWKATEHTPALLRASQLLGAFPDLKGTMSWLPVDTAAKCLLEILFQPGSIQSSVVHLENPVRQPMQDFAVIASQELGVRNIVPYTEWLDLAEKAACFHSLLDFFRNHFLAMASGELVLDTQQSRAVSRTLRGTSAIGRDLIVEYINRWRRAGFLK